jgi:hypothetical protein
MNTELNRIVELEEKKEFDLAFQSYENLYSTNSDNFEVWKHFYFFLWIIIEDMPNEFIEKINRENRLQKMFIEGKANFNDNADFNFIVGYTMSIFPYEFGNQEVYEKLSKELIKNAINIDSENPIYKMAYFGDLQDKLLEYEELKFKSLPIVLKKFNGIGLLNKYFRQVLNRVKN